MHACQMRFGAVVLILTLATPYDALAEQPVNAREPFGDLRVNYEALEFECKTDYVWHLNVGGDVVAFVAQSYDAGGNEKKELRLWNSARCEEITRIHDPQMVTHSHYCRLCKLAPTGRHVVTASDGKDAKKTIIKLWEVGSGELLNVCSKVTFGPGFLQLVDLAFVGDDRLAVLFTKYGKGRSTAYNAVAVLDVTTLKRITIVEVDAETVHGNDLQGLFYAVGTGRPVIWDVRRRQPAAEFRPLIDTMRTDKALMQIGSYGEFFVSTSGKRALGLVWGSRSQAEVALWDAKLQTVHQKWPQSRGDLEWGSISSDDATVSQSTPYQTDIYDVESGKREATIPGFTKAQFLPHQRDLLIGLQNDRGGYSWRSSYGHDATVPTIWNWRKNQLVARLVPLGEQRMWLAKVYPDALIGSKEALAFIRESNAKFQRNRSLPNAENVDLVKKYHRPELAKWLLKGFDREVAEKLPTDYDVPSISVIPRKIADGVAEIELRTRATGENVTLDKLELTIGGRPIPKEEQEKLSIPTGQARHSVTVRCPFPPGKNTAAIVATVSDSFQMSTKAEKQVDRRVPVETVTGRLFVLAVGVSDYKFNEYDLQFASKDAQAIAEFFSNQEGLAFGEVLRQVYLDKQATAENAIKGLKWLRENCTASDVAIVMFSGHAIRGRAGLYYMPHAGDATSIANTCLKWDDVAQELVATNARQVIFLSDACHAGEFGKTQLVMHKDLVAALKNVKNLLAFASSEGKEPSFERDEWGHGAFTKALLEGLSGNCDADRDGKITVAELVAFTKQQVAQLTSGQQHPELTNFSKYDEKLVLTKLPKVADAAVASPATGTGTATVVPTVKPGNADSRSPDGNETRFEVVVIADQAEIKVGTRVLARVRRGVRLQVEDRRGAWLKVTIPGRADKGWIHERSTKAAARIN